MISRQLGKLCDASNTKRPAVTAAVAAHVAKGCDFAVYWVCRVAVCSVPAEDPNGTAD